MVRKRNRTPGPMSKPPPPTATATPESASHALVPQPFRVVRLRQIDSTSDEAARRLRAGTLALPAVVVADVQTAGRGTRGRSWLSTDAGGSLTATFVLPVDESRPVQHSPLLAGLCVRNALADYAGPAADSRLKIKWPNDVLLDGRKLAGLLCERRDGADLIGVGVNLSLAAAALPPDLAGRVASLSEVAPAGRDAVLAAIARGLSNRPKSLADLRRHDFLLGRRVEIGTSAGRIAGECRGIDADGRLLVEAEGQTRRIVSGTVRLVDARVTRS